MKQLEHKHIILTGAGAGIGEATAYILAEQGASLTLVDRNADRIKAVANAVSERFGTPVQAIKSSLHNEKQCQGVVEKHHKKYGVLDVLVHNASTMQGANTLTDFEGKQFEAMIKNNLYSLFCMTKAALPHLQSNPKEGLILATGSISGILGQPSQAPYAGTKAYIHAFIKTLASEQAANGVRANVVAPGPIATQMTQGKEDAVSAATPMGRRGTPYEIAYPIAFLCSDGARYVNGEILTVDGGMVIGNGPVGKQASKKLSKEPDYPYPLLHQYDGDDMDS